MSDDIQGRITDPAVVAEIWGDDFVQFTKNPRVIITEAGLFIKLKNKVTNPLEPGQIDMIMINEPTVGEMKAMDSVKGDVTKLASLLETLSGLTATDVNRMKASDFLLFNKVMTCFLIDGPETGETV